MQANDVLNRAKVLTDMVKVQSSELLECRGNLMAGIINMLCEKDKKESKKDGTNKQPPTMASLSEKLVLGTQQIMCPWYVSCVIFS